MRRPRWIPAAMIAGLATLAPGLASGQDAAEAPGTAAEATPIDPEEVGGLLGVFWSTETPTPVPEPTTAGSPETEPTAAPTRRATATPVPEPTASPMPEPTTPSVPEVSPTPGPALESEPTEPPPSPAPTATSSVPVLGVEPSPDDRPSAPPTTVPVPAPTEGAAPTAPSPEPDPTPEPDLDADLRASRRQPPQETADPGSIRLPPEEIRGELEKPDIFFLLPKARSKSDEQLIRSRIRREITRPLIKDWLEEELLLE